MALPDGNTLWPPRQLQGVYRDYMAFQAWYAGDEDLLSLVYAANQYNAQSSLWGQVRRFFWGTPTPTTAAQRPVKLHVPVPAELARMSAALLFSEMPGIQFGDGDHDADDKGLTTTAGKNAMARSEDILDDRAHAAILEAAELQSALGGAYLKVTWDKTVDPDKPFLVAVAADGAVPTFLWNRLVSVIFWADLSPIDNQPGVWRLLEEHTKGRIEFAVYRSENKGQLGRRMALTDHPETASLAGVVDDGDGVLTGSDLLTAVFVPNQNARKRRQDPVARALGRSDFEGLEPFFDALDETYTSWMRDIRLGRARLMVARDALDSRGPGQGAVFDSDREIFTPLNMPPGSLNPNGKTGGSGLIDQVQFAIRVKEHADTASNLLEQIVRGAGYSVQTFGESADIATTATEINSRERLTMLTRGAKLLRWRPELQAIICALLDVDQHVFNGPGRGLARPDIEWPDTASDSPLVMAQTLAALNTAESASLHTRVGMLHPDWSEEQIKAEVEAIKADYSLMPDPTMAHLWAAQADNASATGGVQFSQNAAGAGAPKGEQAAVNDEPSGQ